MGNLQVIKETSRFALRFVPLCWFNFHLRVIVHKIRLITFCEKHIVLNRGQDIEIIQGLGTICFDFGVFVELMAEDKKYTVSIPLKCPYIRQEQKTKFSVMMNWNANAASNEQAKEKKPPMLQINFNSVALKIETSFMCRRNRFLSENFWSV